MAEDYDAPLHFIRRNLPNKPHRQPHGEGASQPPGAGLGFLPDGPVSAAGANGPAILLRGLVLPELVPWPQLDPHPDKARHPQSEAVQCAVGCAISAVHTLYAKRCTL